MKRAIYGIAILIALAFCIWLALRKPTQMPTQNTEPQKPSQQPTTNAVVAPIISNAPPLPPPTQPATNEYIRPDSIDEETWKKIMEARPQYLIDNQPVEFYARVLDQNRQPLEGVKLIISLERMDETKFAPTNYLHWDRAAAYEKKFIDLVSDAKGWIQLTGVTGKALRIESLSKTGYSWTMPQIDSFAYEYTGQRTVGYPGMEDAFNPEKGYILQMQKIESK
jgi:hypothetical protein